MHPDYRLWELYYPYLWQSRCYFDAYTISFLGTPPPPSMRAPPARLRLILKVVSADPASSSKVSDLLLPPVQIFCPGTNPPTLSYNSLSPPYNGSPPDLLGVEIYVPHWQQLPISGHLVDYLTD